MFPLHESVAQNLPSVASKRVHVRKKHVLIGCKRVMFCRQKFEVWSTRLLSTWFVFAQKNILCKNFQTLRIISGDKGAVSGREICLQVKKNEIWPERADQKHINNLALARQFALTAVKLQMFGGKICGTLSEHDILSRVHALHFRDRRGAASPPYRNHYAEIMVLMCEQKPHPVWFSCRRKSYLVQCEYNLTSKEE